MSAFTPGPWSLMPGFPEYVVPVGHKHLNIGAAADADVDLREFAQPIAMIRTKHRHRSADEQAANARLIAAAPELYAALEAIVADHDFCGDDWGVRRDAWIETARAALAKVQP